MCSKGIALMQKGDSGAAMGWFDKALASPGFAWEAETRMWIGKTFAREGNLVRAVECWKMAAGLFHAKGREDDAAQAERKISAAEKDPGQRSPEDRAALIEAAPVPGEGGDQSRRAGGFWPRSIEPNEPNMKSMTSNTVLALEWSKCLQSCEVGDRQSASCPWKEVIPVAGAVICSSGVARACLSIPVSIV